MPNLEERISEGDIEMGMTYLKQKYFHWKDTEEAASTLAIKTEEVALSPKCNILRAG